MVEQGVFVAKLAKALQMLCHGYLEYSSSIEIIGHINLRIDNQKYDYIVNEQVSRQGGESTFFQSNSYHSLPPGKCCQTDRQHTGRFEEDGNMSNHHRVSDSLSAAGSNCVKVDLSGPVPYTHSTHFMQPCLSQESCFSTANSGASNSRRRSLSRDSRLRSAEEDQAATNHAQDMNFNHSNSTSKDREDMEVKINGDSVRTDTNVLAMYKDMERLRQQRQDMSVKHEPNERADSEADDPGAGVDSLMRDDDVMETSVASNMLPSAHAALAAHSGHSMLSTTSMAHPGFFDTSGLSSQDVAGTALGTDGREAVLAHALVTWGLSSSQSVPPAISDNQAPSTKRSSPATDSPHSKVHCTRKQAAKQNQETSSDDGDKVLDTATEKQTDSSGKQTGNICCTVCGTRFRNEKLLLMHARLVHRGGMKTVLGTTIRSGQPAQGASPNSSVMYIASESLLELVQQSVAKSRPAACQVCQVMFSNQQELQEHQATCMTSSQADDDTDKTALTHVCEMCQLVFTDPAMLAQHKQSGCGEQSAPVTNSTVCPLCSKQFLDPGLLSNHIWICEKAGVAQSSSGQALTVGDVATTSSASIPTSGISSTSGVNSVSNTCEDCGKQFQSRTSLVDHINSMHRGMQFTCPDCGEIFKWRTCVYRHKTRCRKNNH